MRATLAATLLTLLASTSAVSAMERSGGTTSPSMSVPDFDPAAEYRRGIDALKAQKFAEAKKAFGNVLAATGFLYGLDASDLRAEELDARDRLYEVIVGVRAVKAR